jgi:hypothetical protein
MIQCQLFYSNGTALGVLSFPALPRRGDFIAFSIDQTNEVDRVVFNAAFNSVEIYLKPRATK